MSLAIRYSSSGFGGLKIDESVERCDGDKEGTPGQVPSLNAD